MIIKDLINNSAFMGVLGVILGAIVSGIINYMNGKQKFELQKDQNRVEKIEKTTLNFLILMQKISTHNLLMQSNCDDKIMIKNLNSEIFSLNEQVKAEMYFYFDKNEYDLAMEICAMANPSSAKGALVFNENRAKKIDCLLQSINKKIRK